MFVLHEPNFDERDELAVLQTLRSAWVSTGGPAVEKFEADFAKFTGAKHAISVSNGTIGLQLALVQEKTDRKIEGTFEVIVPSLTFIATANAVVHAGGIPRLIDTDPGSLNFSMENLVETFNKFYRFDIPRKMWVSVDNNLPLLAIMPVHVMGWCGDMEALSNFSKEKGIPLFEDAAESLGTKLDSGVHTGLSGCAGIFSFNGNKILTTGGGGMIITNDANRASRLKHLSTTAKSDALTFEHDEIGYNYRLVGILAALGSSQLEKLPGRLLAKQNILNFYKKYLKNSDCRILEGRYCISNNWLVNIEFNSSQVKDEVLNYLISKKIFSRPLWKPIHLQPAYANKLPGHLPLNNTMNSWQNVISLPSSPTLTEENCEYIATAISEGLKNVERTR